MQSRVLAVSTALALALVAGSAQGRLPGAAGTALARQSSPAPEGSAGARTSGPEGAASPAVPAAPSEASIAKAKEVLAAVDEAVGAEAMANLRSFAFEADTRRVFGDREMSGRFTMRFLFPDKFQRVEELERPDGMPGGTLTLTVNGQESWMDREGGQFGGFVRRGRGERAGAPGGPEDDQEGHDGPRMRGGRGRALHGEFYRALVGLLPGAAPLAGLTVAHAGEAQAPNGQTADVLDVTRDGFTARLFVDQQTHLPLMMTYQARSLRAMRRPLAPRRGASEEERRRTVEEMRRERQAQGPPPMVESKLFFSEYGDADGVRIPHKIVRQVDAQVQEEWTITKVELNPGLDPEQFKDERRDQGSRDPGI